jgi:pyruvate dehydrogenase (quinone)
VSCPVPDVVSPESHDEAPYRVHASGPVHRPKDAELDRVAAILNQAQRIAIYGGSGCDRAHEQVLAIAQRLKAPVAHTARAKEFLEHDNPHLVGTSGVLEEEAGRQAILECDILLVLGADLPWRGFYPARARIVQIDADPVHVGRRHPVEVGLVGDVRDTLEALLPRLDDSNDRTFHDACVKRHRDGVRKLRARATRGRDGGISGSYLTELIDRYAGDDAMFTSDGVAPTFFALRLLTMKGRRRLLADLLHGREANAMPTALGLQKCQPGRQVICLSGKDGISMLMGDLITTLQENLPVKIAIYDDGDRKVRRSDFGTVAAAVGLWGRSVSAAAELEEAVRSWLVHPGPALLSVRIRPLRVVAPSFVDPRSVPGMTLYVDSAVKESAVKTGHRGGHS